MKQKAMRFGLAGLMAAGLLSISPAAFASGGGGGITVAGRCTGASTSKLSIKPDNGQIEAEFEVDSNVAGQTWKVKLSDNGVVFFKGSATTQPPSGSFEVRKFANDQAGTDTIKALARNPATGEVCSASATI